MWSPLRGPPKPAFTAGMPLQARFTRIYAARRRARLVSLAYTLTKSAVKSSDRVFSASDAPFAPPTRIYALRPGLPGGEGGGHEGENSPFHHPSFSIVVLLINITILDLFSSFRVVPPFRALQKPLLPHVWPSVSFHAPIRCQTWLRSNSFQPYRQIECHKIE